MFHHRVLKLQISKYKCSQRNINHNLQESKLIRRTNNIVQVFLIQTSFKARCRRKLSKSIKHELDRTQISFRKQKQVICKHKMCDNKSFIFWMKIKVGIMLKLTYTSRKIFHTSGKREGIYEIFLPQSCFAGKRRLRSAIN